jgi:hypothetical protein
MTVPVSRAKSAADPCNHFVKPDAQPFFARTASVKYPV